MKENNPKGDVTIKTNCSNTVSKVAFKWAHAHVSGTTTQIENAMSNELRMECNESI